MNFKLIIVFVVERLIASTCACARARVWQVMPDTVDIRRVERYELLKTLLMRVRRRRRLITEYQVMLARLVRTLNVSNDLAELEVSVYDCLHDQQATRFKEALVSIIIGQ